MVGLRKRGHTPFVCDVRRWQKSGPLIIEEMATWEEGLGSVKKIWQKSEVGIIEKTATRRERDHAERERERGERVLLRFWAHCLV